ncbi:polysaccharide export protein [soil metagenome]
MKSYALLLTAALTVMSAAHAQTANLTQALPQAELYRINAGDDLEVFVWGEDRLQRTVKVLPDGSFSFPLVGRVDAMGRLPTEIEAQISKGLQSQFRNQVPQVTVSVKNPAGLQFSIVGKVKNPGNFSPARYVNVLEAIGIAGGASEFADVSNVVILRKTASGLTPIHVRLSDALRGNPNSRDLAANGLPNLVSGDTVIVP